MSREFGPISSIPRVRRSYADTQLAMFSRDETSLYDATLAVEAANRASGDKAVGLNTRLLKLARARAIKTLLVSELLSPTQRSLLDGVLEVIEQVPSRDPIRRIIERQRRKGTAETAVREHATAIPEANYSAYSLSISDSADRPQDGDLGSVGRPTLMLNDTEDSERGRVVGMIFSQGTFTNENLEGIIIGLGTEATAYVPEFLTPEDASETLMQDFRDFMARVANSIPSLR